MLIAPTSEERRHVLRTLPTREESDLRGLNLFLKGLQKASLSRFVHSVRREGATLLFHALHLKKLIGDERLHDLYQNLSRRGSFLHHEFLEEALAAGDGPSILDCFRRSMLLTVAGKEEGWFAAAEKTIRNQIRTNPRRIEIDFEGSVSDSLRQALSLLKDEMKGAPFLQGDIHIPSGPIPVQELKALMQFFAGLFKGRPVAAHLFIRAGATELGESEELGRIFGEAHLCIGAPFDDEGAVRQFDIIRRRFMRAIPEFQVSALDGGDVVGPLVACVVRMGSSEARVLVTPQPGADGVGAAEVSLAVFRELRKSGILDVGLLPMVQALAREQVIFSGCMAERARFAVNGAGEMAGCLPLLRMGRTGGEEGPLIERGRLNRRDGQITRFCGARDRIMIQDFPLLTERCHGCIALGLCGGRCTAWSGDSYCIYMQTLTKDLLYEIIDLASRS
jgi:hypothetical protein